MSSHSIPFQAKSGVSHSPPLRNATSSLHRNFRIFSPARCTKHTISHDHRVALIPFVIPWPLRPLVSTHGDCRQAPQTNTSLSSAFWPHSCAPRNFLGGHPPSTLNYEILSKWTPRKKEDASCWYQQSFNPISS